MHCARSFNNVLHVFVSKRCVHKKFGAMYGAIAKLYWNESKSTREWLAYTWKAARTGARKNAAVPKAFRAKRKGKASWQFAHEAIGRLHQLVRDPAYKFSSGWLEISPPALPTPDAMPRAPSKATWGKARDLARSQEVLSRRAPQPAAS